MALKKLTEAQKARREEEKIKKMEEEKMQNVFNNSVKNEMVEGDENTMNEVIKNSTIKNTDSFFNNEELSGTSTPIDGLEIEIEIGIAEGRYKFRVKNLDIARNVETKFGIKDKLVIEFHIWGISDGEEVAYDLKQKYNISSSYKSEFYKVYRDLTGIPPRGKINLRNLLGVKGDCEIKHIEMDDRNIFPKVVNINAEIYNGSSEVPAI